MPSNTRNITNQNTRRVRKTATITKRPLTPILLETLSFLEQYFTTYGYMPTQRVIADQLRVSRSTITDRLVALEKKGYIQRFHYAKRGISLV